MGAKRSKALYIYIYIYTLFICLGVCLFLSNKHQNDSIDRANIGCGPSHDPREGFLLVFINVPI